MKKKEISNQKKFTKEPRGLSASDKEFLYRKFATIPEANIFHSIRRLLKKNNGRAVSNLEIKESLGGVITRGTILYHIKSMMKKGIVCKTEKGSLYFIPE